MEPLVKTKHTLIWVHMYPIDENCAHQKSNKRETFSRIIIAMFFIVSLTSMVGSFAFSFKIMSMDMQESLLALIPAASNFNVAYDIVAGLLLRNEIKQIFTKLSAIYSASK